MAQGVLVNVTAGLDLSIGELDDVGSIICEVASDDATTVVGVVIDSEMTSGELRITLVLTGLGKERLDLEKIDPVIHNFSAYAALRSRRTAWPLCLIINCIFK